MIRANRNTSSRARYLVPVFSGFLGLFLLLCGLVLSATSAAAYERLTWCIDPLNMPYSQQRGFPPGFDVEISMRLSEILEHRHDIYWADTGTVGGLGRALRNSINNEKCDAFMGIVIHEDVNAEMAEKNLVLTEPYMAVGLALLVHENSPPIRVIEDFGDKVTAIQNGTYGHRIMIVNKFDYRRFRFENEIVDVVSNQEVDAAILFGPMAGWALKEKYSDSGVTISDQFRPGPDYQWSIGIAVRASDTDLMDDLNRAITQLRDDGEIGKILAKYGVPNLTPEMP